MDKEVELILAKLKIVSEEEERGLYLCDKEHSKILLDYITNLQEEKDKYKDVIDKIKEYITTRTPSDIGISGNKPKKYYTLSEDEVDYILELLEEVE